MSAALMLKWEEWIKVADRKGVHLPVAKAGGCEARGPDLEAALGP